MSRRQRSFPTGSPAAALKESRAAAERVNRQLPRREKNQPYIEDVSGPERRIAQPGSDGGSATAQEASDSAWTPAWFRGLRCLAVAAAAACAALAQSGTAVLLSPGGHLEMTFQTPAAGGQLTYKVTFQGKPVIVPSAMRLELQGQSPLGSSVRMVGATPSKIDET
ncbi:MAG: glycoside hydrolase family 97 N-terminal domain-containing protein, partial [Bryobacteraceae bacterium]